MANTYTQLYIQIVFAVQSRLGLIHSAHKDELERYMTGIVQRRGHKLLAISCMPDHTHLFVGLKPEQAIADLIRDVKAGSSGFINDARWIKGRFSWQSGYGAFSYSRMELEAVCHYILHQGEHHRKRSFREEYLALLKEFAVAYDDHYLFQWVLEENEEKSGGE